MFRPSAFLALGMGCLSLAPQVDAQSQVLFQDDFENGLGAWTTVVPATYAPLDWHLAEPGECGVAVTRMAAIGTGCSYGGPSKGKEYLVSSTFSAQPGAYTLVTLDAIWDMDFGPYPESILEVALVRESPTTSINKFHAFTAAEQGQLVSIELFFDMASIAPGEACHLQITTHTDTLGNTGKGLYLDNVRVASGADVDLGHLEPCGPQPATLSWAGPFTPGSPNILRAKGMPGQVPALMFVGVSQAATIANGVLVTVLPDFVAPLMTPPVVPPDHDTLMDFPVVGPLLPVGLGVYLQLVALDDQGAWSASNTLLVIVS